MYDHVSSLLISLLILVGASVALLMLIWLGFEEPREFVVVAVQRVERAVLAEQASLEPPLAEEWENAPSMDATVSMSALFSPAAIAQAATLDLSRVEGRKRGSGSGDDRIDGRKPRQPEAVPRWKRWE